MVRIPAAVDLPSSTAGTTPAALEDLIERRRRCAAEETSVTACSGDIRVAADQSCTTTDRVCAAMEFCIANRAVPAVSTAVAATATITRARSAAPTATESSFLLLFLLLLTLSYQESCCQKFLLKFLSLTSLTSEDDRRSAIFPVSHGTLTDYFASDRDSEQTCLLCSNDGVPLWLIFLAFVQLTGTIYSPQSAKLNVNVLILSLLEASQCNIESYAIVLTIIFNRIFYSNVV